MQKITPSPLEVTTAKSRDALSRSTEFLCCKCLKYKWLVTLSEIDDAGDYKRVVLVGGSGDCMNATFVDVSNTIPFPYSHTE